MPTFYRICKTKYAATAFDGEGARLYGGRWNSVGTRMVYAASTLSLAILEILVHLENEDVLPNYSYIAVRCPENVIKNAAEITKLPKDWQSSPAPKELQQIGDNWINKNASAVLAVPSAVVPIELNYLLNPAHPDFSALEIGEPERLTLDSRLL